MPAYRYTYLGTRTERTFADLGFPGAVDRSGQHCDPVRRPDGKCVVSTAFSSALVVFADGTRAVVSRRLLRLNSKR